MPAQNNSVGISPEQLQEILAKAVAAGVSAANQMNPLEQKKYEKELAAEERRNQMMKVLGEAEEQARINKQNACTHSRDKEGNTVAKGQGIWTTQGQCHGDDSATLICMRCSTTWHWKATPAERAAYNDGAHAMLGWAPPDEKRLLAVG